MLSGTLFRGHHVPSSFSVEAKATVYCDLKFHCCPTGFGDSILVLRWRFGDRHLSAPLSAYSASDLSVAVHRILYFPLWGLHMCCDGMSVSNKVNLASTKDFLPGREILPFLRETHNGPIRSMSDGPPFSPPRNSRFLPDTRVTQQEDPTTILRPTARLMLLSDFISIETTVPAADLVITSRVGTRKARFFLILGFASLMGP
jgi:hypothetical protein